MLDLTSDLRYTLRSLKRSPAFTAVAAISMAFGIGTNAAVFTLLDQVLVRDLPVLHAGELVQVHARGTESYGGGMGDGTELSYPMYRDLRDHNAVFAGAFCRFATSLYLGHAGHSERVYGEAVSGTFFPTLGVGAALGRVLAPDDDAKPGGNPVAVLGYRYWQTHFTGDAGVIGRSVTVNGHAFQVVGVVEPRFRGIDLGRPPAVYVPMAREPDVGPPWLQLETRRFRWVQVFARLRPGTTAQRAQVGLQPLYASILRTEERDAKAFAAASLETKRQFLDGQITVQDARHGHSGLRDAVSVPLMILMALAGGVMLIVCANVSNLLLVRGLARRHELALRMAVGASRARLVLLLTVESLAVAAAGMILGLVLARWGAAILLSFFITPDSPLAISARPDGRVIAFGVALAAGSALAAGLVSALRVAGSDLAPTLKATGGAAAAQPRLQKALVVAQVSLSILLLTGAGLFLRTLKNLLEVDPGFRPARIVTFSVDLPQAGYAGDRGRAFLRRLVEAVDATPGVSSSGAAFVGLMGGGGWGMGLTIEGYNPEDGDSPSSLCNAVSPGFFATLGIPVVAGREFDWGDDRSKAEPTGWAYSAAVVNETFAKRYFKGQDPIGRHVGLGEDPGTATPIEIVGVVRDAHYAAVREEHRPQIFFPYLQADVEGVTAYVKTSLPPQAALDAMRGAVASLDPSLALYGVETLGDLVRRSIVNERLVASLSAFLSAIATALAIVGLYGAMAYTVTRRRREIGIRMALGARAAQVARSVLRDAGRLVGLGLAIGLGAAAWLGQYLQSQLYGVKSADPTTMAAAVLLLALVALGAAAIPARRAARTAPMTALREE
jgi:putative ABC transport system permease protein